MRQLLIPLIALAASAAQAEPGVISGLGTQSCAELNARTRPDLGYAQNGAATAAFSWVQGYISAWNVIGMIESGRFVDVAVMSADAQWSQVATFCRMHPGGFVFDAARDMLARLPIETVVPMAANPSGVGSSDHPAGER